MLARDGIAAIWTVHLAAARAYRDGNKGVAATITDIADAAERRVVAPRCHCRLAGRIDSPMCGRRTAAPKRERSGNGRLGDFFVPGMNQFFSVTREVFEPYGYSLRTTVKSYG
jgi:hypothetical protein